MADNVISGTKMDLNSNMKPSASKTSMNLGVGAFAKPGILFGSGDQINVDTGVVRDTVRSLQTINKNIDNDFNSVTSAMNKLNGTWSGSAANKANDKFNNIKKKFTGPNGGRRKVMDTYIQFLAEAVAMDYETTESVNTKLSDMFK